jgi:hypothetical protein
MENEVQDVEAGRGWGALFCVVIAALSFVVFLVVPYYVNDLDQYSLAEMSGGEHDPKDLWPATGHGPLAFLFGFGGLFTIFFAPLLLAVAGFWPLVMAITQWRALDTTDRAVRLTTVALAVAAGLWVASPFGQALISWWLD